MVDYGIDMEDTEQHILGLIYNNPGIHRIQIIRDIAHSYNLMHIYKIIKNNPGLYYEQIVLTLEDRDILQLLLDSKVIIYINGRYFANSQ